MTKFMQILLAEAYSLMAENGRTPRITNSICGFLGLPDQREEFVFALAYCMYSSYLESKIVPFFQPL